MPPKSKLSPPWRVPLDPYAWVSDIPSSHTITEGSAIAQYCLTAKQVKAVGFEPRNIQRRDGSSYTIHLYKEWEVAFRAWEMYGGPIGFWHHLKSLQRPLPVLPSDYRPSGLYDLVLAAPLALLEPEYTDARVAAVRARLPPWLWARCNVVLDRALEPDGRPTRASVSLVRVDAILRVPSLLQVGVGAGAGDAGYPARPTARPAGSPQLGALHLVLADAPRAAADWDMKFRARVYGALAALVRGYGLAYWEKARWDVYDAYFHSTRRGVEYNRATHAWVDTGTEWLRPGVPADELKNVGKRRRCDAGRAYNDALLTAANAAARRTSGQRTATSGSGTGSAVAGSTAPSSTNVGTERPLMVTTTVPDGGTVPTGAQKAQPPPSPLPPLARRSFAAVVGSSASASSATRVAAHTPPATAPSTFTTHTFPPAFRASNPSVPPLGCSLAAASPRPCSRRAPESQDGPVYISDVECDIHRLLYVEFP